MQQEKASRPDSKTDSGDEKPAGKSAAVAAAIGSGGPFAQSAARALLENTDLNARDIVQKALTIAGDICVYTNGNQTIEEEESIAEDKTKQGKE